MRKRFFEIFFALVLLILVGFYFFAQNPLPFLMGKNDAPAFIVRHDMVVNRVESLGKLELVKYYIKDIVEDSEDIDWWPFDPKTVLIVSGEVVGCIDLSTVDSSKVLLSEKTLTITLPAPQICYYKVNHKESRVYDIYNPSLKPDAELIDKAYQLAEQKLLEAANKMQIKEKTKENAVIVLKTFLESFTGKKVLIKFEKENYAQKLVVPME